MNALVTAVAFSCGVLLTGITCAADSLPRNVTIGEEDAFARSGPGRQYYATERIPAGAEVQVWRRDAGGWLAIRPMEESFSLVSSTGLRSAADSDVAQVIGDKVVAWVGSNVEEVDDHKWQVRLTPGESVLVQGKTELLLHRGTSKQSMIRIQPPAGEFRWVHETDLAKLPADNGGEDSAVELAQFRVIADDDASPDRSRDTFVPRRVASRTTLRDQTRSTVNSTQVGPRSLLTASEFTERLREHQVELSLLVAQPPEAWNLTEIADDVAQLVDRGSSTLQRARAQRLLEQIGEFEELQSRFVVLRRSEADTPVSSMSSNERAESDSPSRSSFSEPDPLFDGSGWLFPVHSSQHNTPPFALLDSEGRILQFVSPAPGLNLHRYLRKEIGIFGQTSSSQRSDKPHLIAHRIVDLARHRR